MAAVDVQNIFKYFGSTKAVDDISFQINEGEIIGLLGPNGAGKTTTIRMILDIFKPDRGTITVLGGPMSEEKKNLVGYLPEERGLYQDISLEKCLSYLASLKGMDKEKIKERLETYLDIFNLKDYRSKKVKEMSKGMQQTAQLITTFIHQPKLVIVDEPFSSLDPVNTQMAKDMLREERASGTAIMMSTHHMNQAEELCDRILLINKGKIVVSGKMDGIRKRYSKNEIIIRASSPLPATVTGIDYWEPENNHIRIHIQPGTTPKSILAELIQAGVELDEFEVAEPSLDEIFIHEVTGK